MEEAWKRYLKYRRELDVQVQAGTLTQEGRDTLLTIVRDSTLDEEPWYSEGLVDELAEFGGTFVTEAELDRRCKGEGYEDG